MDERPGTALVADRAHGIGIWTATGFAGLQWPWFWWPKQASGFVDPCGPLLHLGQQVGEAPVKLLHDPTMFGSQFAGQQLVQGVDEMTDFIYSAQGQVPVWGKVVP